MKKILPVVLLLLLGFSCSKEKEDVMVVKTKVRGLKKGTFYLQKQIDSVFVSVDSALVNGTDEFYLTDKVESPEIYYLRMANSSKKIPFFGENDTINIQTSLEKFSFKYKISGSGNQELLDKFYDTYRKFNEKDLDLIKAEFDARKLQDTDSIAKVLNEKKRLLKRRYLYAINYAVNHGEHEVAPFIALTELTNAQTKWLDSIYSSLTPEVRQSKYGIMLNEFIGTIKKSEKKTE
jgi:hypothetical protein